MKSGLEKRLETYRDGGVSERERSRVEAILERSLEAAAHLRTTEWLGRSVREAWTEGPPAPSAERILTVIRPELRRIDARRAAERPVGWRWLLQWRPVPLAAFAAAAAALALLLVPVELSGPLPHYASGVPSGAMQPVGSESLDSPTAIYDLAQGDRPVMVFQAQDGSTVIWLLEEDDGISSAASTKGTA